MTAEQKLLQLERLTNLSDRERREAINELTRHLTWKLKGKLVDEKYPTPRLRGLYNRSGAHYEANLDGLNALEHYTYEAFMKLYDGFWEWKEGRSLGEQLIIIVDNLLQKQVEKYKASQDQSENDYETMINEGDFKVLSDLPRMSNEQPDYRPALNEDPYYRQAHNAVKDDPELSAYVDAIVTCDSKDEICSYMGITHSQMYNLTKRLKRVWHKNKIQ